MQSNFTWTLLVIGLGNLDNCYGHNALMSPRDEAALEKAFFPLILAITAYDFHPIPTKAKILTEEGALSVVVVGSTASSSSLLVLRLISLRRRNMSLSSSLTSEASSANTGMAEPNPLTCSVSAVFKKSLRCSSATWTSPWYMNLRIHCRSSSVMSRKMTIGCWQGFVCNKNIFA